MPKVTHAFCVNPVARAAGRAGSEVRPSGSGDKKCPAKDPDMLWRGFARRVEQMRNMRRHGRIRM